MSQATQCDFESLSRALDELVLRAAAIQLVQVAERSIQDQNQLSDTQAGADDAGATNGAHL